MKLAKLRVLWPGSIVFQILATDSDAVPQQYAGYPLCGPGGRDMNQLGMPSTGACSITLNPNFW